MSIALYARYWATSTIPPNRPAISAPAVLKSQNLVQLTASNTV